MRVSTTLPIVFALVIFSSWIVPVTFAIQGALSNRLPVFVNSSQTIVNIVGISFFCSVAVAQHNSGDEESKRRIAEYKARQREFDAQLRPHYLQMISFKRSKQFSRALGKLDEIKDMYYGTEFKYRGDIIYRFECYFGLKDWKSVISFETIDPSYAYGQSAFIAEAHLKLGNIQRAIDLSDPKKPDFFQIEEGREDYPTILKHKDLEARIKVQQGYKLYKNSGSAGEQAFEAFVESNRLRPNMPVCLFYLASCYARQKRYLEALAVYRKVSGMKSTYAGYALGEIERIKRVAGWVVPAKENKGGNP